MNDYPCKDKIDRACFEARPEWARRAFAYRLLCLFAGPVLSRRLPKGLREYFLPPDYDVPPDVDVPPGVIVPPPPGFPPDYVPGDPAPPGYTVPPDATFPPGWIPTDPLPPGVIPPPGPPPWPKDIGAARPPYIDPWSPGPPRIAPRGLPSGAVVYFNEPFDDFTTNDWTKEEDTHAHVTIDDGHALFVCTNDDEACAIVCTAVKTISAPFEVELKMNIESGDGVLDFNVCTGVYRFYLTFSTPLTIRLYHPPTYTDVVTTNYMGQDITWKAVLKDDKISLYRDDVLLQADIGVYPYTNYPGRIAITNEYKMTTSVDSLIIKTPT